MTNLPEKSLHSEITLNQTEDGKTKVEVRVQGETVWLTQADMAELFQTTPIPVAILVFGRSREKGGVNQRRKDVLFVDASREYLSGTNQNALSNAHIEKILATVKTREGVDKYAHVSTFDEIKENDFNLNIARYVDTFEEEEEIDIDAVQQEIEALEKELAAVRAKMVIKLKEIER
jgi:type I restriction enzyme M protein